jgi:hypothetical protein
MHELMQTVVNQYGKATTELIPQDNIQIFYHGMHWSFQQEDRDGFTSQFGQLQKQQTKVHLEIQRIREHDIAMLPEFVKGTVEDMKRQMEQRLISVMNEATEKSGNVAAVSKGGSIAEAALEALEKVQLSIDADGNVCLPTLYLNPASYDQMTTEIVADPFTHSEAAKKVIEKKKEEALSREQERLSRYDS